MDFLTQKTKFSFSNYLFYIIVLPMEIQPDEEIFHHQLLEKNPAKKFMLKYIQADDDYTLRNYEKRML